MGEPLNSDTTEMTISLPHFVEFPAVHPPATLEKFIAEHGLVSHGGGGYFKETDRSPFQLTLAQNGSASDTNSESSNVKVRDFSSLISVLYTPDAPFCKFLRLEQRSIHILQRGKGQVVLIYPDGQVKSFKVGFDYRKGEVHQWVVPGGVFKACVLLPNEEFDNGLLISEIVVPGFDFNDCELMSDKDQLIQLVGEEQAESLKYLL